MNWLILVAAGLMEIAWAVAMKYSNGFTKLVPSIMTIFSMAVSVFLLALALRSMPLGVTYAIWTGIGAAGTALVGMTFLGEPRELIRIICIFVIIAGIIGLKVFTKT